jgi:hypothetical protein
MKPRHRFRAFSPCGPQNRIPRQEFSNGKASLRTNGKSHANSHLDFDSRLFVGTGNHAVCGVRECDARCKVVRGTIGLRSVMPAPAVP